ncbi:MAG: menaquinone biosynthesis family protein [Ktedonobacteraceae bacterium]
MSQRITVGHSPDTDDIFMIYGLATGQIDTQGLLFDFVARDIETLNSWAQEGRLEVTAMSAHAFAYTKNRYRILSHGASMGENYGPIVVTRRPCTLDELRQMTFAIPGTLTSGFLMLRLLLGDISYRQTRFDAILEEVASGRADAGLIIYEGQLTFQQQGLHMAVDLGQWWHEQTGGLPFPLSINTIRTDLDLALASTISNLLKQSVRFSLDHRQEALAYALRDNSRLDVAVANQFIDRYVNFRTIDMGPDGRRAIAELLARGHRRGILPEAVEVAFLD